MTAFYEMKIINIYYLKFKQYREWKEENKHCLPQPSIYRQLLLSLDGWHASLPLWIKIGRLVTRQAVHTYKEGILREWQHLIYDIKMIIFNFNQKYQKKKPKWNRRMPDLSQINVFSAKDIAVPLKKTPLKLRKEVMKISKWLIIISGTTVSCGKGTICLFRVLDSRE